MPAAPARFDRLAPGAVAALLAALTAILLCATFIELALVSGVMPPDGATIVFDVIFGSFIVTFGGVGAVLASRVPRNPIGWIMSVAGLAAAVSMAGGTYAGYDAFVAHGSAPFGDLITWLANWLFTPGLVAAIVFIPLLFPTGRLPSRRWRPIVVAAVTAITFITLESAFGPWPAGHYPGTPNPYEIHGPLGDAIAAGAAVANVTGGPALLLVLGSLVFRFRRSKGVERQQFKWFAFAGGVAIAAQIASNLTSGPISDALFEAAIVVIDLVPIAIGIAVLRYRLYDIDRVINRTIVYGLLTAVLVLVYGGSVLTLEALLAPLTRTSSLAVAASTLLVAALFTPVRRRVQTVVDRRFYRRRYDSAREIAGFGSRLRDELEPEHLTVAIASTIDRTVQPSFASIWLREAPRG